jgi:hypothetical protein
MIYRILLSLTILLLSACEKFAGEITKVENDCRIENYSGLFPCYYLENISSSKLLKFTIKKTTKTTDGRSYEYFDTYKLNPGEKVKIGSAFLFDNNRSNKINQTFEIVGQLELSETE